MRVPGLRTVPRTVYPRSRRSLTSHDATYPPAPVTHTVCPRPGAAAVPFPSTKVMAAATGFLCDSKLIGLGWVGLG